MAIAAALHSSLQHEMVHGHPTRSAAINEALVFIPLPVFYPYRRFKSLHLRHHHDERLTDPYDDPESYYLAGRDYARLPAWLRFLLQINNSLAGRLVIGPALMVAGFYKKEVRAIAAGDRRIIEAWLRHAAGLVPLVLWLELVCGIPFWLYVLAPAYAGLSIIAIRTFCEHRWANPVDGRTIIVENAGIMSWLFLNNNLHLVHHTYPTLPWYMLPALYRTRRAEWIARNSGYVFDSYLDIARRWLFARKEPVIHPALPAETAGHAFVAAPHSARSLETASVPASPPAK